MAKRDRDDISETGNWNVADQYSKLKIMRYLYLSDEYANIAKFGSANLIEEIESSLIEYPIDSLRLKGFRRLVDCLITLIDNCLFAIKNKKDKEELEGYNKELGRIYKIIKILFRPATNQRTKEYKETIIAERYDKILERVLEIKREINGPLNRSHLIFTDKEEFDPVAYKKEVFKQATTRG